MNSANEDGHINQPEDLICESNKSSQLFGGHYNEKFWLKNVIKWNEYIFFLNLKT